MGDFFSGPGLCGVLYSSFAWMGISFHSFGDFFILYSIEDMAYAFN